MACLDYPSEIQDDVAGLLIQWEVSILLFCFVVFQLLIVLGGTTQKSILEQALRSMDVGWKVSLTMLWIDLLWIVASIATLSQLCTEHGNRGFGAV